MVFVVMVIFCCFFLIGICVIIVVVNVSVILVEIRICKKCYIEEINDLIESMLKYDVNYVLYFLIDVIFYR